MGSSLRAGFTFVLLLAASVQAQVLCGDCNANGSGPDILDALSAAQISAGIVTPSVTQLCSCDVNNDGMQSIIDALLMAQAAAGLPVSITCPMSPCGGGGGGVAPTTNITAPTGGVHGGDITITFDADDGDSDPLALFFEWSTDAGVTYTNAASTGAGSIPMSPVVGVPVPVAGGTFVWASALDGVGTGMIQTVSFRLSASDGTLPAQDIEVFDVDNTTPMGCPTVACGQTVGGVVGPGTQGMITAWTGGPAGDTAFFMVDTSARMPGDSAQIALRNISDDCDIYWAAMPGVLCGSTVLLDYFAGSTLAGLVDETFVIDDATLTAYGDLVPIAVYHWDPAPTATFDVEVTCFPVMAGACTTILCGQTQSGATGPGSAMAPPGVFTPGPTGDSTAYLIDVSGRAPGQWVTVRIHNLTDDHDLFVPNVGPGITCGDPTAASYFWSETGGRFGTSEEFQNFDDAYLTTWGNMIPVWVYHYDTNPTGGYDISVDCVDAPTGTCGSFVDLIYNRRSVPFDAIGNNTGAGDDSVPSCQAGGEESTVAFIPAATATYTFRTCDATGMTSPLDTVMSIREGDCSTGVEIACNDDGPCGLTTYQSELISIPMTQGVTYFVNIDGWNGATDVWVLAVTSP